MSTLTETAIFSKKASVWVVIGIIALISLILLWIFGGILFRSIFPPKSLPASVAFGKLPSVDYGEINAKSNTNYLIETVSGELPVLANQIKVFKITVKESSFGALDNVKKQVKSLGFVEEPQLLSGSEIKFINDDDKLAKNLTINIASGDFTFSTNFKEKREIITSQPESVDAAINRANDFLNNFSIDFREFPESKIEIKFFRIDGNNLTETQSISSANLVQVIFKRADIDGIRIVNSTKDAAPIKVLVSNKEVVDAEVAKKNIRYNNYSTYPLKGALRAFEDLKNGRGSINTITETSNFTIRQVNLAYLETSETQQYLQPIYVFESDNGIFAYSSAVDDVWIIN